MANLPSVEKRHRQSLKRRARNVATRSGIKSALKKLHSAITEKDPAKAQEALRNAARVMNSAASKGVIHRSNASRRISRLSHAVHGITKK